jgi:hypothetical protein
MNGTFEQQDRQAFETAKPIFQWAYENQQYYSRQRSAARVMLLPGGGDAYRGLFRLLSEEHIPFAVSSAVKDSYELVIASGRAPRSLLPFVEHGGKLLIVSSQPPEFDIARVVSRSDDVKGYVRVRNHTMFPSLNLTELLMLNGPFTEVEGNGSDSLTLVPPSMIGPPEKIHVDMRDTTVPAIVTRGIGKGTVIWIPWELGALYYRHSLPAHAGLFRDTLNTLQPRRQLKTNAHPLVEMTLMQRGSETFVHLVNLSGHSQTGYFPPIPMRSIQVEVEGRFKSAAAVRRPGNLPVRPAGGYTTFTIPELRDYEMVVLK